MQVTITQEAQERIIAASRPDKTIRINGELVGGCGMNVEYALWWDEANPTDQVIKIGEVTLAIDSQTIEHMDADKLTIDYRSQQGFRLVTPAQILAYGIQLKDRWV
ncbi:iron-sulfur cluster biosynthesis family protein [Brevibacillus nitrificans]|uniref:iron-sulfur cluster biosynthesis family protein n=1 Tax=Brevibacillus nitrificans TaxID=651560 RepID=UPI00285E5189|nr:iron-sulfur cluster biosynthesis family protein [Brevibacillus nitrificans]MDR7316207.1 Fe-S cluster assembly iron-binding protein IscA [Brevibacillus nitrificans]